MYQTAERPNDSEAQLNHSSCTTFSFVTLSQEINLLKCCYLIKTLNTLKIIKYYPLYKYCVEMWQM